MYFKILILLMCVIAGIPGTPVPEKDSRKIAAATYKRSSQECSALGAGYGLPVYQGDKNIKRIENALSDQHMTETWLPLKRRKFDTWYWVDGQPVDDLIARQPWRDYMDCGMFHNRDTAVEVDNCTLGHLGYVCEFNGTCAARGESSSSCIEYQGRALVYGCSVDNWYDARYQCKRRGMDLAIIRDPGIKKFIHDQWYAENRKQCHLLWIGLRREDWVYHATGVTEDKSFKPYWAPGLPNKTHDCAVISKDVKQNRYFWRSSGCNIERPALCLQNQEFEFVTPKPLQALGSAVTTGAPPAGNSGNKAGLAVGLIFLFLILIVAGIAFYKRGWIMEKVDEFRNDPKEKFEEDQAPLINNKPPLPPFTERFDHAGGSYRCPNYDVTLEVPPGALTDEGEITVEPKMDIPEFVHNIPQGHVIITPIIKVKSTEPLHKYITATVKHSVAPEMKKAVKVYQRFWDDNEKHRDWSEVPQEQQVDKNTFCEVFPDKLEISLHETDQAVEILCTCMMNGPARLNLKAAIFAVIKGPPADSNKPLEVEIHTTIFHSFYSVSSIIKDNLEAKKVESHKTGSTESNEQKTASGEDSKQMVFQAADLPLTTPSQDLEATDEMEIAVFDIKEAWEVIGDKATTLTLDKLLTGRFPWIQAASTFTARHTNIHQEPSDFNLEFVFALHKPAGYKGHFDYQVTTTKSSIKIPVTKVIPKPEAEDVTNPLFDRELQQKAAQNIKVISKPEAEDVTNPIFDRELQQKAAQNIKVIPKPEAEDVTNPLFDRELQQNNKEQTTKDTSVTDVLKKEEEDPYDTIDPAMMDQIITGEVLTGTTFNQPHSSKQALSPAVTKTAEASVDVNQPDDKQEVKIDHDYATVVKSSGPERKLVESTKEEEELPPPTVPPKRLGSGSNGNNETSGETKVTSSLEGEQAITKGNNQVEQGTEGQREQVKPKTAKEIKAEKKMEQVRRKKEEKEQKLQREREKKEEKEMVAREKKEKKQRLKANMTPVPGLKNELEEVEKEADTSGLLAEDQEAGTAPPGDVQQRTN